MTAFKERKSTKTVSKKDVAKYLKSQNKPKPTNNAFDALKDLF